MQMKRIIYDLTTLSDEELNNISNITLKIPKNSKHKENDNSVEEKKQPDADLPNFEIENDEEQQTNLRKEAHLQQCLFKSLLIKEILKVTADRRRNGLETKLFSQDEVIPRKPIEVRSRSPQFKTPSRAY